MKNVFLENSKYISIQNRDIHYVDIGEGELSLLFLHGVPTNLYL